MPSLLTPALPAGSLAGSIQPVLDGDGVRLRPWRAADADTVVAAYADPDIQRWHCRTMTDAEARDWIARWPARWRAETAAGWAVTGQDGVAGQISLRTIDLFEGLAEVSYWVLPHARGRGTAGRALRTLTDWAFGTLGLHRIVVCHSTANHASCRVADRAGYPLEGTKRGEVRHTDGWHDMHLHARVMP
ncbi:GNAT family N-acetyltransferase [Dactylosporangium sp. NPDC005555]|uniref:GNAT family N-acetyltransferase n=1 Tax=Dactylosporangium sp. NPDC005555 TaxID=3154889 RepID=UPI0033AAC435